MKKWSALVVVGSVGLLCAGNCLGGDYGPPVTWGHYRELPSTALGEQRTVLVHLPSDYEDSEKAYPVLYQLDGTEASFVHCTAAVWYQAEMAERTPGYIVVGIRSVDRYRDFGERADDFRRFISGELIPFIDSQYRTTASRILFGQSAGSVYAFRVFLDDLNLFDGYILSSFGLSDADAARYKKGILGLAALKELRGQRLFFAEGTNDPYDPTGTRSKNGREAIALLRSSMPDPSQVVLEVYDDGGHAPFRSVYDALEWLHAAPGR